MNIKLWILVVLFAVGLIACRDKKVVEAEKIIKEWYGKTIVFPENLKCSILGMDTASDICSNLFQRDYKILLYIDSTGCSGCRLNLPELKQFIVKVDTLFHEQVGVILFFQPKNKKEMSLIFREANFVYPVFIDPKNTLAKLNHLPNKELYQCFLLDRGNKVLRIGNPLLRHGIWEMYRQSISGNITSQQQNLTSVEIDKTKHEFGTIKMGESAEAWFQLKNTGIHPLAIHNVSTSCGCTTVEWNKQMVKPKETTPIKVVIKPDEERFFNKVINVHCNTKESPLNLVISGTANKNIVALAVGDDFSAQNTGPASYEWCDPILQSGTRLKYCDCENPYPCTQALTCP
jgi:hypothetical protein